MNVHAAGVESIRNNRQKFIGPITCCDALIVQAVCNVLNVTIRINESIEGWAPVTVISPISGQ